MSRKIRNDWIAHVFYSFICIVPPKIHLQLIYTQLALGWQIAKQLSGLKPPSLSSNKNYSLKKSGVFSCIAGLTAVKPTIHQNSAVSKALLGKF